MRPAQIVAALVVSACVPIIQVSLLGLCYLVGNYLSMAFIDHARWTELIALIDTEHFGVLRPTVLLSVLRLDWISGGYLLLGAGCLATSYRLVLQRSNPSRPGKVLAFPALILSWFAGAAVVVASAVLVLLAAIMLLGWFAGPKPDWASFVGYVRGLLPFPIGLAACALYYAACIAGTHASAILVATWSPSRTTRDLASFDLNDYLFWR